MFGSTRVIVLRETSAPRTPARSIAAGGATRVAAFITKGMTRWAGKSYDNPGVSEEVTGWEGSAQPSQQQLNSSLWREDQPVQKKRKRPEGSTIQPWNGEAAPAEEENGG